MCKSTGKPVEKSPFVLLKDSYLREATLLDQGAQHLLGKGYSGGPLFSSNTSPAHQLQIGFCSTPKGQSKSSQPPFRVSLILFAISFALVCRD